MENKIGASFYYIFTNVIMCVKFYTKELNMEKDQKRLTVDVHKEFHKDVKSRAAKLEQTITEYVLDALFEKMKKERE